MAQISQFNKKNTAKILALMLSFAGVLGLGLTWYFYKECIVGIALLPVFYFTFNLYSSISALSRGKCISAIILSLIYSTAFIAGIQLDSQSEIKISLKMLICVCLLIIEIFPLIIFLLCKTDNYVLKRNKNNTVYYICLALLIFSWGLIYLALFPGVYATDAPYWYHEFYRKDIAISSQWSPVYCGIFYLFMRIGKNWMGSFSAGFAIFSLLQMTFSLCIIGRILHFINTRLNEKFLIGTTLFYMLPTHTILALTSAQDSVFAACLSLVLLYMLEYIADEECFVKSKNKMFALYICMILMCVARNNGLYATLVLLVVALFLRIRKRMLLLLTSVVITMMLFQGPVYSMLGISKSTTTREMLSLPLQQMAYAYNNGNLTQIEKNEMEEFVSQEGWQSYRCCISDNVKSKFNTDKFKENRTGFIKLYMKGLFNHPIDFIQGMGLQTFTLWYPDKKWPDDRPWHPYIDILCYGESVSHRSFAEQDFMITRRSLFPQYELFLEKMFGYGTPDDGYGGNLKMFFEKIPVVGTLFQAGLYSWIILYIFMYSIYRKNRELFIAISLILGVWITVFLSPVIMYRYCAPFIFAAPIYISAVAVLRGYSCLKSD